MIPLTNNKQIKIKDSYAYLKVMQLNDGILKNIGRKDAAFNPNYRNTKRLQFDLQP